MAMPYRLASYQVVALTSNPDEPVLTKCDRGGRSTHLHEAGLQDDIRLVQRCIQLLPPLVKVCFNVLIVISVSPINHWIGPQRDHGLVYPLAHSAEMFILLIAQAKDAEIDALHRKQGRGLQTVNLMYCVLQVALQALGHFNTQLVAA